MKTCPKCSKEHELKSKFCSLSCARSRTWLAEDKLKKSIGGKKFYQTDAGEINKWIKGQRSSRQGYKPYSDPAVQEKLEDDYIIPHNFEEDTSKYISDGDVWFVDE